MTMNVDWDWYDKRCEALEAEGLTRSDAQAVVDAELMEHAANLEAFDFNSVDND